MSLFLPVRPSVQPAPYLRNRTSCDHNFWYTCGKWWWFFFFFSKFWFLRLLVGYKCKKWSKIWTNSLSCFIFQEPDIIWFLFMVHICKMIIPQEVFFIFLKVSFFFLINSCFFKFISKYQPEILRCAPPSSHVHDFI